MARNFVATHLFGPIVVLSIVTMVCIADPDPGPACWTMTGCAVASWLLPLGLRFTQDLRLMALVSVELLSVVSLIGTSYYGGVNSPFLPWLVVSLMLGLFYLSDHAFRVICLFALNIVAAIEANVLYKFPQHLSLQQLGAVSWFSVFTATGFMSIMAIYYASIITMSSRLERETERHRMLTQRLRKARQLADTASHGKSVFLGKMQRQFEEPLMNIAISCAKLSERSGADAATADWTAEIDRIEAAGQRLIRLVHETVDPSRFGTDSSKTIATDVLQLDEFVARFVSNAPSVVASTGHALLVDKPERLGTIRLEAGRLKQAMEGLLGKAATAAAPGDVHLRARRYSDQGNDWIEFRIRTPRLRQIDIATTSMGYGKPVLTSVGGQAEAGLEMSQMQFAVMGGSLDVTTEPQGSLCYIVELPVAAAGLEAAA